MATPRTSEPTLTRPTARLAASAWTLPAVAPSVANYVPAVHTGCYVLSSGQLPFVDGALVATGKVGAEVSVDEATELTRISGAATRWQRSMRSSGSTPSLASSGLADSSRPLLASPDRPRS